MERLPQIVEKQAGIYLHDVYLSPEHYVRLQKEKKRFSTQNSKQRFGTQNILSWIFGKDKICNAMLF